MSELSSSIKCNCTLHKTADDMFYEILKNIQPMCDECIQTGKKELFKNSKKKTKRNPKYI